MIKNEAVVSKLGWGLGPNAGILPRTPPLINTPFHVGKW